VVVPPEEQLINEIAEPRHGKIRRIIKPRRSRSIAASDRVEPFARQLCERVARPAHSARRWRSCGRLRDTDPGDGDHTSPRRRTRGPRPLRRVVRTSWCSSAYATKNRRDDGPEGEGLAGVAPRLRGPYLDTMICRAEELSRSTGPTSSRDSSTPLWGWRVSHRPRDAPHNSPSC